MIFAPASQFHVYLPCLGDRLAQCLKSVFKCERASQRFQPGKGPFRNIVRDCEILANLRLKH